MRLRFAGGGRISAEATILFELTGAMAVIGAVLVAVFVKRAPVLGVT